LHWILRSPEAEYSTRLSTERAIASLEKAMAEGLCRGAVTARRAQRIFAFWVGTAFTLTALSSAFAGPRFGALLLAVVTAATWTLLRAASRAMERGIELTGKLIESALQPLASPSVVLLARRRKPAA